jgi:hypothetical protein
MILKETVSYYLNQGSPVFCTFLDASKAFDRVNYCKLFRLLMKRDLPACIIRVLMNMYTGHLIRISWAGVMSGYFNALNGVKQGGVVSPVLFCIYIDDLLVSLSQTGVGCYMAGIFVGAIAYADDIVLISPTPLGTRKLLLTCETFANEFDILFNANKSKFLVCTSGKLRSMFSNLKGCLFYIGGSVIENVSSYSHLGHIINYQFNDKDDILQRKSHFTGQANNVFCFFKSMDMHVKIKLFKSYCSSCYGSELWLLDDEFIQAFCCSWRSALRRLLNLPCNTHCFLLPLLTDSLPVYDEICKRSARFILSCLNSRYRLVRCISRHSVIHGGYYSLLWRNTKFCCRRYGWLSDDFVSGLVSLHNNCFSHFCLSLLEAGQLQTASVVEDLFGIREGFATFDCDHFLTRNEICILLNAVCTS